MPDDKTLQLPGFTPNQSRPRLLRILALEARVEAERPTRAAQSLPLVLKALEIATNGYRRNCLSSGQLAELEAIELKLAEVLA